MTVPGRRCCTRRHASVQLASAESSSGCAQILKEKKQHTKPPVSLVGQLLWREFFYCAAALTPNFHRMEGSPICRQIPWDDNEEFYRAWDEARTGAARMLPVCCRCSCLVFNEVAVDPVNKQECVQMFCHPSLCMQCHGGSLCASNDGRRVLNLGDWLQPAEHQRLQGTRGLMPS